MQIRIRSVLSAVLLLSAVVCSAAESGKGRYWEWGWGVYGGNPADVARFDWSILNFGNIPDNQSTVDYCNAILAWNPKHKFVIRIWPLNHNGSLPENRYMATIWDYLYNPDVRQKMQKSMKHQYDLINDGITARNAIIGMTFLEELPGHCTNCPFRECPKPGEIPWDIKPYLKTITAELGHAPDFSHQEDALWWGRKFVEFMNSVHAFMRKLQPSAKILYWPATCYYTLDMTDKPMLTTKGILPFRFGDLMKSGICDGIMGYPNTDEIWQKQCMNIVAKYDCLFFSQLSQPAFMRLSTWDDTMRLCRTESPANLGLFLFSEPSSTNAWNTVPDLRDRNALTLHDVHQWFCNKYGIGNEVAERQRTPDIHVSYSLKDIKAGDYITISLTIHNHSRLTWVGQDISKALLRNLTAEITGIPDGCTLPKSANGPAKVTVPILRQGEFAEATWWLLAEKELVNPDPSQLRFTISTDGFPKPLLWAGSSLESSPFASNPTDINGTGERLLLFPPARRSKNLAIELTPLKRPLPFPSLVYDDQSITYNGVLNPGESLRIMPGKKAEVCVKPLFTENILTFNRKDGESEMVFDDKYQFWTSPRFTTKPGHRIELTLTGYGTDNVQMIAFCYFIGNINGKDETKSVSHWGMLKDKPSTEKRVFTVPPDFTGDSPVKAYFAFYRYKEVGKAHLVRFDSRDLDHSGGDVSPEMLGWLSIPHNKPFFLKYIDMAPKPFWGGTIAEIRLINPE